MLIDGDLDGVTIRLEPAEVVTFMYLVHHDLVTSEKLMQCSVPPEMHNMAAQMHTALRAGLRHMIEMIPGLLSDENVERVTMSTLIKNSEREISKNQRKSRRRARRAKH